jgi:hypothetical protein
MWSAQEVETGRITPCKTQGIELLLVEVQVLVAPARLLAGHDLALAESLLRARTPSTASIAPTTPRM